MADLYLGYAAFAYYTKENGYEVSKQGNGLLSLWLLDAKMHVFTVYTDAKRKDCGCVYTNDEDLEVAFSGDINIKTLLVTKCKIPYWGLGLPNTIDPPCSIDSSLRGKISTVIRSGETVSCKRKPVK